MPSRPGEMGWMVVLAGLPWSFFLLRHTLPFQHLDIWHANSWWMQAGGLLMAGVMGSRHIRLGTLPPAAWWLLVWTSLVLLFRFTMLMRPKEAYLMAMLSSVANLWLVVLIGLLLTGLPAPSLQRVSQAMWWSGVVLVSYGLLQLCNLDPFFQWIDGSVSRDTVAGTIGNSTHFGTQLALWMPFLLIQSGWRLLWVVPAFAVILGTQSSTALALVGLLGIGWAFRWDRRAGWGAVSLVVAVFLGLCRFYPEWLDSTGRIEVWKQWLAVIRDNAVFGGGLGFAKHLAGNLPETHPLFPWKHLHNEYLQWWVETGVIGVGLLGWLAVTLWRRRSQGTPSSFRWACGWSFSLCGLLALVSFPWHLWQIGSWGLFSLCGWWVCTEPVL